MIQKTILLIVIAILSSCADGRDVRVKANKNIEFGLSNLSDSEKAQRRTEICEHFGDLRSVDFFIPKSEDEGNIDNVELLSIENKAVKVPFRFAYYARTIVTDKSLQSYAKYFIELCGVNSPLPKNMEETVTIINKNKNPIYLKHRIESIAKAQKINQYLGNEIFNEDFLIAHFNSYENPDIENTIDLPTGDWRGGEHVFNTNREKYKKLETIKNLLIVRNANHVDKFFDAKINKFRIKFNLNELLHLGLLQQKPFYIQISNDSSIKKREIFDADSNPEFKLAVSEDDGKNIHEGLGYFIFSIKLTGSESRKIDLNCHTNYKAMISECTDFKEKFKNGIFKIKLLKYEIIGVDYFLIPTVKELSIISEN
ncbi:hypothetical protein [Leptospira santarosai]|uniref:hypothetical protein n=1 Tax=Leptospira santarosai TaxID=28183 RepID=UPI0002BA511C|nr:hypothetical protein [Leptospira santarosai]EMF91280.1 putative lipoprotein [Leptospira santarosai str. ST188]EMO21545.1 putative lipoprotein [Leptospira santarosai str. HAI134]MDI7184543.1 hypothetical protein [Leptospira santarosai]